MCCVVIFSLQTNAQTGTTDVQTSTLNSPTGTSSGSACSTLGNMAAVSAGTVTTGACLLATKGQGAKACSVAGATVALAVKEKVTSDCKKAVNSAKNTK